MTTLPVLSLEYETNQLAGSAAREQKNYNWSEIETQFTALGNFLQGAMDGYDLRFNNMIANAEQVNEVVDSRVDLNNNVYPTLKARLDAEQEATPQILDAGTISDAEFVLLIKDLSATASTTNIYYSNATQIADLILPAMGYSECSAAKISYDVVAQM